MAARSPARRCARPRPPAAREPPRGTCRLQQDRKSTRLNSSHGYISYAVFCLKKKKKKSEITKKKNYKNQEGTTNRRNSTLRKYNTKGTQVEHLKLATTTRYTRDTQT